MAVGAVLVWLLVLAIAAWAARSPGSDSRDEHASPQAARWLIVGGGVVLPTVVLGALLGYGLWLMPRLRPVPPADALRVEVSGEQWWWRVRYLAQDGAAIETANELRMPLGEPVVLELVSPDVIHSLWIPALGGKLDMIPGRRNTLVLQGDVAGTYRGICAEFCGASHAWMNFEAVVLPRDEFDAWLALQARDARPAQDPIAAEGAALFARLGCGACHTVRGTGSSGTVGPDLTHVGSRLTLAAGRLPNTSESLARWVHAAPSLKPGARMPAFDMLQAHELQALGAYLEGLQ